MAQPDDMLDDEDYPAYTMGRAAEIVGCSQDFLRRLDEAKLIDPHRSAGGHRRYSRYQLRLAARAREMCDQGTDLEPPAASSSSRTNSRKPSGTTRPRKPGNRHRPDGEPGDHRGADPVTRDNLRRLRPRQFLRGDQLTVLGHFLVDLLHVYPTRLDETRMAITPWLVLVSSRVG